MANRLSHIDRGYRVPQRRMSAMEFGERRVAFVDLKSVSWDPESRERLYKGCHAERVAAFDYALPPTGRAN